MESLQHQVLCVEIPSEDFDPNFTPEDGEQYLQQVVYERRKCPSVVVKPFKKKRFNQTVSWRKYFDNDVIDACPTSICPTKEWRKIQINCFAHLRAKIVLLQKEFTKRYDPANEAADLIALPGDHDQELWLEFCKTNEPFLKTILQISQRTLEVLIEYLLEWLGNASNSDLNGSAKWLATWIYACLACLQLPLEPSAHSSLRQIARACIQYRNILVPTDMDQAAPLNLLICIISYNFSQKDLSVKYLNPN